MTYRRTGRPEGYVSGQFKRTCDRSGRVLLARDTRKEWNGLIVDKDEWEARNAQEFVRGVVDDQTAPEARPLPAAVFRDDNDNGLDDL